MARIVTCAYTRTACRRRDQSGTPKDLSDPRYTGVPPGAVATHKQVPPPADFHRALVTFNTAVGQFDQQTDVGGPLAPGSASYDSAAKTYTINSAGYNIWYQRDEFR